MPDGFRWKDQNISDDEYARRRELIRELVKWADANIQSSLKVNDVASGMQRVMAQQFILITLPHIFGQHEVDHALDEGRQRIGNLPYAN